MKWAKLKTLKVWLGLTVTWRRLQNVIFLNYATDMGDIISTFCLKIISINCQSRLENYPNFKLHNVAQSWENWIFVTTRVKALQRNCIELCTRGWKEIQFKLRCDVLLVWQTGLNGTSTFLTNYTSNFPKKDAALTCTFFANLQRQNSVHFVGIKLHNLE